MSLSNQIETNPHFLPPGQRAGVHWYEYDPTQSHPPPHGAGHFSPTPHGQIRLPPPSLPQGAWPHSRQQNSPLQGEHYGTPATGPRIPERSKTKPHTWLIAAFCVVFWIIVILGGLIVLVVYLIFRPRSPRFDLSSASLNAAYLDMGYLLNADMTLLANFTNPSKKATVDFKYMVLNLYFENTPIATTYVEPFAAMKAESAFRDVHLVSSQVWLPSGQRQRLQRQIEGNRVQFVVKTLLRTRSNLGSFFRYSYTLYGHCKIEVTGPPSGVMLGRTCTVKR